MGDSIEKPSLQSGTENDERLAEILTEAGLREEISELRARVDKLQVEKEKLQRERDALLKDNRRLRRKVTHSALVDDLHASLEETEPSRHRSTASNALFHTLPDRFRFPEYFRLAEDQGLDSNQARQRLLHYLTTDRLEQSGAYLKKTLDRDRQKGSGDGQKL